MIVGGWARWQEVQVMETKEGGEGEVRDKVKVKVSSKLVKREENGGLGEGAGKAY